jgi:hypothetical protein
MKPGSDSVNGCASSPTEAGPARSRATTARRVASDSAWNTASSAPARCVDAG